MAGRAQRAPLRPQARQLAAAAGPGTVEIISFEVADRCGCYFLERPGYIAKVTDFLKMHYSINAEPAQPPS